MAFVFAGLLPLVAAATGVTISQAGHLVTAYSLAYAIGTPILATMTGAADRKRVILGALILFVAGNIAAATSDTFSVLTASQIVMGMAAGLFAATAQATAVMLAGPEHRAKAVAAVVGGTTFAVALGAPLGSLIGNLAGWRATFLFVGLLGSAVRGRAGADAAARPARREADAERADAGDHQAGHPAVAGGHLPLSDRRLRHHLLSCAAGDRGRRTAGNGAAGNAARLRRRRRRRQLCQRTARRPARADPVVILALILSSVICVAMSLILELLPSELAGPLLVGIMVPWGFIGWTFPPAQASRIVGHAPELANLTLPLNASAMYFGIASGSFIGGQLLHVAPPSELGFVAAGFPLVGARHRARQHKGAPRQRAGRIGND